MPVSTGNDEIKSVPLNVIMLTGEVTWGATGAVTTGPDKEQGFVVAETATGRFTITFTHTYAGCIGYIVNTDSQGTVIGATWETFTPYVASTGVLVLSCSIAESEADPTSGNVSQFTFFMHRSNIGPAIGN